jgi:hypothetical protein
VLFKPGTQRKRTLSLGRGEARDKGNVPCPWEEVKPGTKETYLPWEEVKPGTEETYLVLGKRYSDTRSGGGSGTGGSGTAIVGGCHRPDEWRGLGSELGVEFGIPQVYAYA